MLADLKITLMSLISKWMLQTESKRREKKGPGGRTQPGFPGDGNLEGAREVLDE